MNPSYPAQSIPSREVARAVGYNIAGPLYLAFGTWLCQKAAATGMNRFFLCARDGYPLLEVLRLLGERWNQPLEVNYLYASRLLFFKTSTRSLNRKALDFILMGTPGLTLRNLVERCQRDPLEYETALKALGFDSLDMPITSDEFGRFLKPEYQVWLEEWILNIGPGLLKDYETERALMHEYLQEQGGSYETSHFVDLGWKGTLIRSLQQTLREGHPELRLRSLLFGSNADAKKFLDEGGSLDSCFFHLGRPAARRKLISEGTEVIELLFSAPHPTIVGLEKISGQVRPVYGKSEHTPEQLELLEIVRNGAYDFVREFAAPGPGVPEETEVAPRLAGERLARLVRNPTLDEALFLGSFGHKLGHGGEGALRWLAKIPEREKGTRYYLSRGHAYSTCFWKKGFLAQVSGPESIFLRFYHLARGIQIAYESGTLWESARWFLLRRNS